MQPPHMTAPRPTSPQALHFNVDIGSGCRPETSLCVPCLDHTGRVLAVLQVCVQPAALISIHPYSPCCRYANSPRP
eukprot:7385430-Prymnesium_polylepis.1